MRRTMTLLLGASFSMGLGCVPGPAGDQGPPGPEGKMGNMGDPGVGANTFFDCPIGYTKDSSTASIVLCKRGVDEVVRVGAGGSAFWIDRYEASVWDGPEGTNAQYGGGAVRNYPTTFPRNGQWTKPAYAVSKAGVYASSGLSWFQALEACRASGKRLPTNEEWQTAARGTPDPQSPSNGSGGNCLTARTAAPGFDRTGSRPTCTSAWGAQDMIGSLSEMTSEVLATVGGAVNTTVGTWPTAYNDDVTVNVVGETLSQGDLHSKGMPAVVQRGGSSDHETGAGVFFLDVSSDLTHDFYRIGFRCVVPR